MNSLNKYLSISFILIGLMSYGQSNNCGGAPVLPVGASCNYSAYTIPSTFTNSLVGLGASIGCANDWRDGFFRFVATSTQTTVQITDGSAGPNPGLAIYSGTCGALVQVACSENGNGTDEVVNFTTTIGTTYYIAIVRHNNDNSNDMTGNICVQNGLPPAPPSSTLCNVPAPICSGSSISFTASNSGVAAQAGNNYGCLFTRPNPTWFYMEIANPGNLNVNITAGSDIDFALWGPYANLAAAIAACGSYPNPIDCSYSAAATEQANIVGATTGQVYVLLVTNYANTIQTITVNPAGGSTATTNCAIVPLAVELVDFNGSLNSQQKVDLRWSTASEINNESFAIQRSSDGEFWETIGMKAGFGTTNEAKTYAFVDEKPILGISYYRLLQTDFDGTSSFSNVISFGENADWNFTIYPMPASDQFSIVGADGKIESVEITNNLGSKQKLNFKEINGTIEVNSSGLSKGSYILQVATSKGVKSRKLIII